MKQNELFNKCCENIDPKTREEVWKQMDKELGRTKLEQAAEADVAEVFERMELTGEYVYTPTAQSIARGRFKAGAEWQKKQFSDILDKWEEHAIRGMKVGASAYHQGKIALICDLRDWIKEQTKNQ